MCTSIHVIQPCAMDKCTNSIIYSIMVNIMAEGTIILLFTVIVYDYIEKRQSFL